ncbi:MAG: 23S rRNA (uracil(1939)-C(5))-methyltransferase RlmD [Lactobacillus sp.]|nr:23S rRNA (uracil(1939)-C(5))-methyltransferase RlmD [Lactobacillus sp.]
MQQQNSRPVIISIKRLGINGEGIGYYRKKIIFVPGALSGEVAVVKIINRQRNYLEGRLIRLKETSPDRVRLPKGANPRTGGLELAHLAYPAQLAFKTALIKESLAKYHPRAYRQIKVQPTIPADQPWHYRQKAQYQAEIIHGKLALGLYATGSRNLVDLPQMPTQGKESQQLERRIRELLLKHHISIASRRAANKAGVKTVVVRASATTHEAQVTLITIGQDITGLDHLVKDISHLPNVTGVFQNITQWTNPQVWGNKTRKLWGQDFITEKIHDCSFQLSPQAFFQLNPAQTVKLYDAALQMLGLQPTQTLIDAYSGIGTLGILAASSVSQVIGIETIPAAVQDAQRNCRLNHARNAEYYQGAVEKVLPALQAEGLKFDALIVDPPRTGLAKSMIKTILAAKPRTFVYISCNPSTLAQDLVLLSEKYQVRVIKSIDMFPQTPRCEAVAKLILR